LLALFLVHLDVPDPAALAVFFLSFLLGYLVGLCMNFILNCTAFWTLEISAVQLIVTWVTDLLGGQLVPLVFFPAAFQSVLMFLPFAAMFSTPLLIYVGRIPPAGWGAALAVQAGWLTILALASIVIWRAGAKRVVVQGG
jgi:ABC-2 type transport system permease protein